MSSRPFMFDRDRNRVTTNVCATIRDACMRDYWTMLVEDCAGAPTRAEHESAVYNVRKYFGSVTDSVSLMATWMTASHQMP
jgi:nicotinamidase-related amidase